MKLIISTKNLEYVFLLLLLFISCVVSIEFFNLHSGTVERLIEGSLTPSDKKALIISPYIFPFCLLGGYLIFKAPSIATWIKNISK
jgi:hypothetical protein